MRLIDADKLELNCIYTSTLEKADTVYQYSYSEQQIEKARTVEAIPIEWISQWLLKNCYDGNGHYIGEGYDTVEDMLEDWRKEQNEG